MFYQNFGSITKKPPPIKRIFLKDNSKVNDHWMPAELKTESELNKPRYPGVHALPGHSRVAGTVAGALCCRFLRDGRTKLQETVIMIVKNYHNYGYYGNISTY